MLENMARILGRGLSKIIVRSLFRPTHKTAHIQKHKQSLIAATVDTNESDDLTKWVPVKLIVEPPDEVAIHLSKEATRAKKEGRFDDAISFIQQLIARQMAWADCLVETLIRYANYLQLAGRSDDGWRIFEEIELECIPLNSYRMYTIKQQVSYARYLFKKREGFHQVAAEHLLQSRLHNINDLLKEVIDPKGCIGDHANIQDQDFFDTIAGKAWWRIEQITSPEALRKFAHKLADTAMEPASESEYLVLLANTFHDIHTKKPKHVHSIPQPFTPTTTFTMVGKSPRAQIVLQDGSLAYFSKIGNEFRVAQNKKRLATAHFHYDGNIIELERITGLDKEDAQGIEQLIINMISSTNALTSTH